MTQSARLLAKLSGAGRIHVDARVFAHHLRADPRYLELTRALFGSLRSGRLAAQSSAVLLYQLLAEVYRHSETVRAAEIARILSVHRGLELVPVTPEIAAQAAQVRAQLGGRPERALQIATGLLTGAEIYLTEGSGLRRIAGMTVVNLEDIGPRP
ncbi:MAG: type II toxin-antitoxin system VapC family toxin [Gemmatimonadota bacterium]